MTQAGRLVPTLESTAAAWFGGIDGDSCWFGLNVDQLDDPEQLVGTLCHEVAHAYRAYHGLTVSSQDIEEALTDLTTVYLGFGVLTTNNTYRYRTSGHFQGAFVTFQTSASTGGYLDAGEMAFLLAIQAVVREPKAKTLKAWRRELETTQQELFDQALETLRRDELLEQLDLRDSDVRREPWNREELLKPLNDQEEGTTPHEDEDLTAEPEPRTRSAGANTFRVVNNRALRGALMGSGFGAVLGFPALMMSDGNVFVVPVVMGLCAGIGILCATDGEYGSYLKAVEAFQRTYNTAGNDGHPVEQLDVDGDFGPATWRGVFDCYQVHLAETLECTTDELVALQGTVRGQFLKRFVGCGENKPKEMTGVDNYRSQTNRRVEVLFFEPEDHVPEVPCLGGECDPAGCELYDRAWYLRRRLSTSILDAGAALRVQLLDENGQPERPGVPYELEVEGQFLLGTTKIGGQIDERGLPKNGTCIVRWGEPIREAEYPRFAEIHLDTDRSRTDEACIERRYWNLGYWSPTREENGRRFQVEYGLSPTPDNVLYAHCCGVPKSCRVPPGFVGPGVCADSDQET